MQYLAHSLMQLSSTTSQRPNYKEPCTRANFAGIFPAISSLTSPIWNDFLSDTHLPSSLFTFVCLFSVYIVFITRRQSFFSYTCESIQHEPWLQVLISQESQFKIESCLKKNQRRFRLTSLLRLAVW